MKTKKFGKLFMLTIALTATLIIFKSGGDTEQKPKTRSLLDQAKLDKVCNAVPYSIDYFDQFEDTSKSLSSYLTPDSTDDYKILIGLLKTNSDSNAQDYVTNRLTIYLVFVVFAILALLSFIFYCICCCCPYLCCKKSSKEGWYRVIAFFIVITLYVGVGIGCIIGFVYADEFVNSMNGTTCALLTFYSHVVNGEEKTTPPRWAGPAGLAKIFDDTIVIVDQIQQNHDEAFTGNDWIKTDPPAFEKKLQNSYDKYKDSKLDNPNPATSKREGVTEITPIYITNYGNYDQDNTALNLIHKEFTTKIKTSVKQIDQAEKDSKEIKDSAEDVKSALTAVKADMKDIEQQFKSFETEFVDLMIEVQETSNESAITGFSAIFAVYLFFAITNALSMLFYVTCGKFQWLRYLSHFIWIVTLILVVLTFLVGVIFGLIGIVATDGTSVLQYIFSKENLEGEGVIFTDKTVGGYINTCVNLDGDMATRNFNLDQGNTNFLSNLYEASRKLKQARGLVQDNRNSEAIDSINTEYKTYQDDIKKTTAESQNDNHIPKVMGEWNKYTDSSTSGSYQNTCSSNTNDRWAQASSQCQSGYTEIAPGGDNIGSRGCLIFPNWSSAQVSSRYSSSPAGCTPSSTDFSSFQQAAVAYLEGLKKYVEDNKSLVNNMIDTNTDLNSDFKSMANNLIATLDKMSKLIDPLLEVYESIVGDKGFFSFINCLFMKEDLNNLFNQFQNGLGSSSLKLAGCILAVSFMQWVSISFLLVVIFRYRGPDKEGDDAEVKDMKQ